MAALFFRYYGFVSQYFPGKVFNDTYTEMMYSFFLRYGFVPLVFLVRFLMRHHVWLTVKGDCYETMAVNLYCAVLIILLCDDASIHSTCMVVTA